MMSFGPTSKITQLSVVFLVFALSERRRAKNCLQLRFNGNQFLFGIVVNRGHIFCCHERGYLHGGGNFPLVI